MLHHAVSQPLFMSAMSRCKIQTVVALFNMGVNNTDQDDRGNFKRVRKYLKEKTHEVEPYYAIDVYDTLVGR